jgi:hypothetical protein
MGKTPLTKGGAMTEAKSEKALFVAIAVTYHLAMVCLIAGCFFYAETRGKDGQNALSAWAEQPIVKQVNTTQKSETALESISAKAQKTIALFALLFIATFSLRAIYAPYMRWLKGVEETIAQLEAKEAIAVKEVKTKGQSKADIVVNAAKTRALAKANKQTK